MDAKQRLELIRLLAAGEAWESGILVGRAILDFYYPANIFDGSSGDSGPEYVVALRRALERIEEGRK